MKQIILILEGKSSTEIDYKYIKSVMDYYYDTRKYSVKRINANGKSKLMDQEKRIKELVKRYNGDSIVVIVSDFDREDDILNNRISDYSKRNLYDLVWMNRNIEDVFL